MKLKQIPMSCSTTLRMKLKQIPMNCSTKISVLSRSYLDLFLNWLALLQVIVKVTWQCCQSPDAFSAQTSCAAGNQSCHHPDERFGA